jgi:hypothetical protein
VAEKQSIETKAVESLKEIGRRLARFSLKVDFKIQGGYTVVREAIAMPIAVRPVPGSGGYVGVCLVFSKSPLKEGGIFGGDATELQWKMRDGW